MTMSHTEYALKKINDLKSVMHFSLDIYYNDIDDTFVVKISNIITNVDVDEYSHFREKRLCDSLRNAYKYLLSISPNQLSISPL